MAWWNFLSLFRFQNFQRTFQGNVNEVELGRHTIKSHGAVLAKKHVHDWLILSLLIATEIVLFMIHPFRRFVGKSMMTDLKYPMKPDTVPTYIVPVYAVLLPVGIFLLFYARRRDVYDLHHATLGLLYAVLITGVITDALKVTVGRPRPDFFWRCFPDGVEAYDKLGKVKCHGDPFHMKEAYKSFPSGHVSWSFAGLGFLALYLSGKIKAFDRRGHVAKLCILFLPLLAASLVAVSRVDDYWHHWTDVFAAGLIGFVVAAFCYLQFFPPPHDDEGWGPYAYFEALDESRSRTNTVHPLNALNMQATEAAVVRNQHQQARVLRHAISLPVKHESSLIINDIESGTR